MKIIFLKYVFCLGFVLIAGLSHAQFIVNTGLELNNSSLIVTNGSWTNNVGSVITNNGTITTSESFTNNGTLNPSEGGFNLNFATDLNFTPGGSQMGFLTKTGAGLALVSGTLSLKDSLLLNGGVVRLLNTTDTISVRSGGLVLASPSSYIEGLMARAGSGDLAFPVGTNGFFLPITLYNAQASKITVGIMDTPVGITAGPGVDSLISFPYAWKVEENAVADTAAYVEVSYPNVLPTAVNPIIVRQTTGNKFSSMGARFILKDPAGIVTIKSYSRGLKGLFSVAAGFPVDPTTDSLALVALYDSTNGAAWITKSNWTTGPVESWFGVTKTGQTITALSLPGNNLNGEVPQQFVDINGLQTINIANNNLSAIPDFTSNTEITSLDVSANELTFESLEPNAAVPGLQYVNQAPILPALDSLVAVGLPYNFEADAGGQNTLYQWFRNGVAVDSATSATYSLPAINRINMGDYIAEATNPLLPALKLSTEIQNVLAYANVSGNMFATTTDPATQGKMTLFRITPTAYDTIAINTIEADGTFNFEKVILDDYQLLGFVDTLAHEGSIPTYYKNTIFWEEADTLFIEDNISGLAIISETKPAPSTGRGVISGILQQDDGGGRTDETMGQKRVSGAGVSARRVETTGRGKEEILTLVAYVFTNEDGEFSMPNLPEGEYRINIQYPGYPMDESSFITIPIGSGLQSQVQVEANIIGDKITVRKLLITGIYEKEHYSAEVYPNPAVDFIHLKFGKETIGRNAVMMDIGGKTVLRKGIESKDSKISIENLQKGLYLLHIIEHGNIVKSLKVSIE